ncbi:hypothetical protein [Bathymodiolus japonicus methanotrophic gill symbiont]|nr:hypothetical protein [Bathymodiolus japonicus methanotrophic gill symbiont]
MYHTCLLKSLGKKKSYAAILPVKICHKQALNMQAFAIINKNIASDDIRL